MIITNLKFFKIYKTVTSHKITIVNQNCKIKATGGGQGSKKHVDLILKIPSLWCQRFLRNVNILLRSEVVGVSMCWPFDFSIVILGVIFDIFYTSFGYKIEILRPTP